MNYFNNNNQIINQLMKQRDNIDNLISQYSQQPQAPVQNIINTSSALDFEARILKNGENINNILIARRTLFVDEKNAQIVIKEVDGSISKTYKILVPKDEKDLKIDELQREIEKLKEAVADGASTYTNVNDETQAANAETVPISTTSTSTKRKSS